MNAPQVRPKSARNAALKNSTAAPAAAPQIVRNTVIRAATARDASALFNVLIRYFEELKLFYPPPVEGPLMAWGLSIVIRGGVVVAEEDGQILGSVGLEIGNFPWAPTVPYMNGVWFYVVPERRAKSLLGERLMKAAKDIAVRNKMGLRLDNVFGIEPELQDAWREKHGFQYVGGNHVWFPPPVKEE